MKIILNMIRNQKIGVLILREVNGMSRDKKEVLEFLKACELNNVILLNFDGQEILGDRLDEILMDDITDQLVEQAERALQNHRQNLIAK